MSDNESRFQRIEDKVDAVKDEVTEIKVELKEYTAEVKRHVGGDEKIINEIAPIIEDFKYRKMREEERNQKVKSWAMRLGLLATVVGLLAAIRNWS